MNTSARRGIASLSIAALLLLGFGCTDEVGVRGKEVFQKESESADFRVLSWNVSGAQFFEKAAGFRTLLKWADADLLLLDEVDGGRSVSDVQSVLRGLRGATDTTWNVVMGAGGGYQRGVIATRYPLTPVGELNGVLPYPQSAVRQLQTLVPEDIWTTRTKGNLDAGIAVAGAIVRMEKRTILAVTIDLQCCSGSPDWQEVRRQIEVREIREVVRGVLERQRVDAVLLAGDFNLVSTGIPLVIIASPYPAPHFALTPVEALHLDGVETWTWDGRNTPFPSRALDYAFYSANSLQPVRASVISTEDFPASEQAALGVAPETSHSLSAHLPLLVGYRWRTGAPR